MNFILSLLLSAVAVVLSSYLLPGVHVATFLTAIGVAIVLALLNAIIRPLLIILTIPVTVITLGLFLLVINAVIVQLADALIGGFVVGSFWWALAFSIILSFVNSVLESITRKDTPQD